MIVDVVDVTHIYTNIQIITSWHAMAMSVMINSLVGVTNQSPPMYPIHHLSTTS